MPAESRGQHWPAGSAVRQSKCPGAPIIGTFFPFYTNRTVRACHRRAATATAIAGAPLGVH